VENETNNNEEDNEDDVEVFNIEEFKNELNNDTVIEDEHIEINEPEPEPIIINKPEISFNNDNSFISKSSYKSNKSKRSYKSVSFKKNNNNLNNEKSKNIIDVIQNTNVENGDIEDLKKRRSNIIIIR
jgi:hypothetical protein